MHIKILIDSCIEQLKGSDISENLDHVLCKESLPFEMRMNTLRLVKFLFDKSNYFRFVLKFKNQK